MWNVLLSTKSYFFWLISVSLLCFLLERVFTWRREQKVLRKEIGQDVFFLVFNGHYAGLLLAAMGTYALGKLSTWIHLDKSLNTLQSLNLLSGWPLLIQALAFLTLKDFISWVVHRLLHRVPWMWEFHKLHHSITELDWIGNFRFHWMEIVFYKAFTWLPLMVLGVSGDIILIIAVIETLIGHLNHANLPWSWGKLGYIFNSPRFHAWHHDVVNHGSYGQNYAIVFSFWDWIFRTAYYPVDKKMPEKFGFKGMQVFPRGLAKRLVHPLGRIFQRA
jgi:sterol desaturase/sphingolipid hydroxylase (fatty acid hydroxylase superfamily)